MPTKTKPIPDDKIVYYQDCKCCGKNFATTKVTQLFLNKDHYAKWRKAQYTKVSYQERNCDYIQCGKVFKPIRKDQRFCEADCRSKEFEERNVQVLVPRNLIKQSGESTVTLTFIDGELHHAS